MFDMSWCARFKSGYFLYVLKANNLRENKEIIFSSSCGACLQIPALNWLAEQLCSCGKIEADRDPRYVLGAAFGAVIAGSVS